MEQSLTLTFEGKGPGAFLILSCGGAHCDDPTVAGSSLGRHDNDKSVFDHSGANQYVSMCEFGLEQKLTYTHEGQGARAFANLERRACTRRRALGQARYGGLGLGVDTPPFVRSAATI